MENLFQRNMKRKVNQKFYDNLVEYVKTSADGFDSHGDKALNYTSAKFLLKHFDNLFEIMKTVNVINLSNNTLPQYETVGAAGMDLRADFSRLTPDNPISLKGGTGYFDFEKKLLRIDPMARVLIPTGLKVALPEDIEMQIRPRSGMAWKKGLTVINTPGTIDEDYRGEIGVVVINLNSEPVWIEAGERICQAVFNKVEKITWNIVDSLDNTERGEGGFNSTGSK